MAKLTNKALLLSVLESNYGQDPGSGYTAIMAKKGIQIKPTGEKIERDVIRQTYSPAGHVIGAKEYQLSFEVELKGGGMSGATLQPPEIDSLLRLCSMNRDNGYVITVSGVNGTFTVGETLNNNTAGNVVGTVVGLQQLGSTSVLHVRNAQNEPNSGDDLVGADSGATADTGSVEDSFVYYPTSKREEMASGTLKFYRDGILHLMTGARGTWSGKFEVGRYGVFGFEITGIFNDPVDETDPTPTFSDVVPPICFGANLHIADLDMSLTAVTTLELKMGNTITPRPDINADEGRRGFEVTDRTPTGSVDPEATDLSDFNPFTKWKEADGVPISCAIGSNAGNRISPFIPDAVYGELSYGDRNGIVTYGLPFTCRGDNDDELYLVFF